MKKINDFAGLCQTLNYIEVAQKAAKDFIMNAVKKETFHKVLINFDAGDNVSYPEASFFEIVDIIDIQQDERQEEPDKWNNHFYAVAVGNSMYMHESRLDRFCRYCNVKQGDREKIYFDVNEDSVSIRYSKEIASEFHVLKRMTEFCCEEKFVRLFKERGNKNND